MKKKKFEFNKETEHFCIDPAHLAEGLEAANGKYSAISVEPLDLRTKNLAFDLAPLVRFPRIKRLFLHRDLVVKRDQFAVLEQLTALEELSTKEYGPLDYGNVVELRRLILTAGTELHALDKVRSLELVYLGLWNAEALPKSIGAVSATAVRISASRKLAALGPLCELSHLEELTLQDLPALRVGKEINKLTSLKALHVEKCGWTDFSVLRSDSLLRLFASKVESLHFIKQLKHLDDLFFWECVDGDLSPVLHHPTLTKIRFFPAKQHYSHKLPELQAALVARNAGRA